MKLLIKRSSCPGLVQRYRYLHVLRWQLSWPARQNLSCLSVCVTVLFPLRTTSIYLWAALNSHIWERKTCHRPLNPEYSGPLYFESALFETLSRWVLLNPVMFHPNFWLIQSPGNHISDVLICLLSSRNLLNWKEFNKGIFECTNLRNKRRWKSTKQGIGKTKRTAKARNKATVFILQM